MDEFYTLPGIPSDLIRGDSVGLRQIKTLSHAAGGIPFVADAHTRVHRGEMFRFGIIFASLANDATFTIALTTPDDDWPHVVAHPALDGSMDFQVLEGATITGGTELTIHNHKRYSEKVSGWTAVHSPTISDEGLSFYNCHMPGGTGPMASGSANGFDDEFPLKSSTTYLFRITNRSGQARRGSLCVIGYKAPEIPDA